MIAALRNPVVDWEAYDAIAAEKQTAFNDTMLLSPGYTELHGKPFPGGCLSSGAALPKTQCPWPEEWAVERRQPAQ